MLRWKGECAGPGDAGLLVFLARTMAVVVGVICE
jgi:hypothetical protein